MGDVSFGTTRDEVAALLGEPPDTFERGDTTVDAFDDRGMHIHYGDGRVQFIETFEPASLEHDAVTLAAGDELATVLARLQEAGLEYAEQAPDLYAIPELGVGLWAPGGTIESAGAYCDPGYYD